MQTAPFLRPTEPSSFNSACHRPQCSRPAATSRSRRRRDGFPNPASPQPEGRLSLKEMGFAGTENTPDGSGELRDPKRISYVFQIVSRHRLKSVGRLDGLSHSWTSPTQLRGPSSRLRPNPSACPRPRWGEGVFCSVFCVFRGDFQHDPDQALTDGHQHQHQHHQTRPLPPPSPRALGLYLNLRLEVTPGPVWLCRC